VTEPNPEQPNPPALYQGSGGGRFPVPDPTTLTTEALRREVASLQVLIEQRIGALSDLTTQSITSLKARSDEKELRLQEQLAALEARAVDLVRQAMENCDTKFNQINRQLTSVEAMRVEQKADTKAAVDAALTAQKEAVKEQTSAFREAVAKSEAATTKQIDDQGRRIDELKDTSTKVESKVDAVTAEKRGATDYRVGLYAAIAVGLAIAAFIVGRGGP
jgi:chemotaxis protein histidine kinase CheA